MLNVLNKLIVCEPKKGISVYLDENGFPVRVTFSNAKQKDIDDFIDDINQELGNGL